MILDACVAYGVEGGVCVMVGDRMGDLQAAASAGVSVRVLVETGYGLAVMGGRRAPRQGSDVAVVDVHTDICRRDCLGQPADAAVFEGGDVKDGDASLPSVLPFVYARDLRTAVEWILS